MLCSNFPPVFSKALDQVDFDVSNMDVISVMDMSDYFRNADSMHWIVYCTNLDQALLRGTDGILALDNNGLFGLYGHSVASQEDCLQAKPAVHFLSAVRICRPLAQVSSHCLQQKNEQKK